MRRLVVTLATLMILVVFAGQALAKEITVRGSLQRTVEPGGWLIVSGGDKYLILNSQRFRNEKWFVESTEVEAVGETKDVMTTYMEGTPFDVRSMRPLSGGESASPDQNITRSLTRVMVKGEALVQARPDTATVTVSVVTQSARAIDAQQQNAARSDAVVRALKDAAGPRSEVKTSGYSLQPQRVYKENQPPTIVGYEARNSVTVVLSDLTRVGPVIDAAAQAGANDVSGISFTLKQDRPARDQALAEATREARDKANVIARALGGRVVRVLEVQEEGTSRPIPLYQEKGDMMRTSAATPIEVGSLDITSRVQMIAEIEVG